MPSVFDQNLLPAFDSIKDDDETILWIGKPTYYPYMWVNSLLSLFPIIFGCVALFNIFMDSKFENILVPIIAIGIGSIIIFFQHLSYSNIHYAYSNKRIWIRYGLIGTDFIGLDYDEIQDVSVSVNIFERFFNVGSIYFFSGKMDKNGALYDVWAYMPAPYEVFKNIKRIISETKKDVNYLNKLHSL